MLAGDQAAPSDLAVAEVPAAHLVVQQVARQSGQMGGFVHRVREPLWGRCGACPRRDGGNL